MEAKDLSVEAFIKAYLHTNATAFPAGYPAPSFPLLQAIFDSLIHSFVDDEVGISQNFLNTGLASRLKKNLTDLYGNHELRVAGTGNELLPLVNRTVRSDMIYWLDRKHKNPDENAFFDLMDLFVTHLNRTCYTGITGYEFHYALYEKDSFYKKHLDSFRNDDRRKYSMILYLNEGWVAADGGELCIHHPNKTIQLIAPEAGKGVFFRSNDVEHEVLITHKPRMSITGWLKTS